MPVGAGFAPAGLSYAGYGIPSAGTSPINATLPLAATGLSQTGRIINPVTRDYIITSDGRLQGAPSVQQLVQLALTTTFNSSAVAGLGQTIRQIKELSADFAQQATARVNSALANLVRQKLVQVLGVSVQTLPSNPDAAIILVQWRDLTTGIQQFTQVGSSQ